jgi:hypothetical protein
MLKTNNNDNTRNFLKRYRKALSVRLSRSQPGRHRLSKPKNGTEVWRQNLKASALGEIQAVIAMRFRRTNNSQPWKDNSARGGGKEQHNRVDQSREVSTGAPHYFLHYLLSSEVIDHHDWSCRWCETYVSESSHNCSHQRTYCSSPRWYVSMECHGDDAG